MKQIRTFYHQSLVDSICGPGETVHVFCRHGVPLLLIPRKREIALATLALYVPQKPLAKLAVGVVNALVRLGLVHHVLPSYTARGTTAQKSGFETVPKGFLLCNPEHGCARAVAVVQRAEGLSIVKFADANGAETLNAEQRKLEELAEAGAGCPKVLGHGATSLFAWLEMERVIGTPISTLDSDEVLILLRQWMLPKRIPALENAWLSNLWCDASEEDHARLSSLRLRTSIFHGDFFPWNVVATPQGVRAIDWEWAEREAVAGVDPVIALGETPSDAMLAFWRECGWEGALDLLRRTAMRARRAVGAKNVGWRTRGDFIAFEGADGVGKSTVMKLAIPEIVEHEGFQGYTFFHWKPIAGGVHNDCIPEGAAHDPRGKGPRSRVASLVYLAYHWLTFWKGYLRYVRPAVKAGRLVVADRYTYDVLLDPRRFRLNVPHWALRVFVQTLPQPTKLFALYAKPSTIRARKPELSEAEIEAYQKGLLALAPERIVPIEAEAKPGEVARKICVGTQSPHTGGF